jgi:SAM-dependent methyltransferase
VTVRPAPSDELRSQFGDIDIYLFDQILKGRFDGRPRVLDAGTGDGRNLIYFLRRGFACFGIDREDAAIGRVRLLAATLAPQLPSGNFQAGELDALPWSGHSMDAVICSAVLHFASDAAHFGRMIEEMWRVLAPNGLFFARLASTIGLERLVGGAGRRVRLPDGTERFVVDEAMLRDWSGRVGGEWLDPIKTTNVQQQRCMTTWCLRKPGDAGRALVQPPEGRGVGWR